MPRLTRQTYIAILSVLALLTQLLAPSLAMASGAAPSYICNPGGKVSAEMQAGIDELKAALGIQDDEDVVMDCDDCVASVHVLFVPTLDLTGPTLWLASSIDLVSHDVALAKPRGPPLGSRAPPFNL